VTCTNACLPWGRYMCSLIGTPGYTRAVLVEELLRAQIAAQTGWNAVGVTAGPRRVGRSGVMSGLGSSEGPGVIGERDPW